MLIRKNTKAFKTILEIVATCRDRPDRGALIRLFITKAGDSVRERISIEGIQDEAGLFYEMNYQAVLGNLKSSNHQLCHSDEIPGVYFFHSSSNKVWDETPFEFDEVVKKEFGTLPELPVLRKKQKAEKFIFPAPKVKTESRPARKGKSHAKKEKVETKKSARVVDLWPKQPEYKLKHEIHFTGLERIAIRGAQLTKRDVLDYYNKIAEYLLPYLKDHPQLIRLHRDGQPVSVNMNIESLALNCAEEIPDWIRTAPVRKGKAQEHLLFCNDREHLLFYVQIGCLEFHAGLSRLPAVASAKSSVKSPDSPDYIILAIESPDYELARAIDVALATKEIVTGLQLPCFVKTDGTSGLHIYIPLDSKSAFHVSTNAAEYLCKLVRLKIPDLVVLKGSNLHAHGKVTLDYLMNEPGKGVVTPYSLVAQSANVATPLLWEEVKEGLKVEAFTHETIFKRLKEGDPFETLFRKKASADSLLEKMEENYAFLF